jgi:hypothetical protein
LAVFPFFRHLRDLVVLFWVYYVCCVNTPHLRLIPIPRHMLSAIRTFIRAEKLRRSFHNIAIITLRHDPHAILNFDFWPCWRVLVDGGRIAAVICRSRGEEGWLFGRGDFGGLPTGLSETGSLGADLLDGFFVDTLDWEEIVVAVVYCVIAVDGITPDYF